MQADRPGQTNRAAVEKNQGEPTGRFRINALETRGVIDWDGLVAHAMQAFESVAYIPHPIFHRRFQGPWRSK